MSGLSEPTAKPLHVQVAEALGMGWVLIGDEWRGLKVDTDGQGAVLTDIPRYDTDWSATGPLIERYGIEFERNNVGGYSAMAYPEIGGRLSCPGKTHLLAACDLFITANDAGLALKEAGKL